MKFKHSLLAACLSFLTIASCTKSSPSPALKTVYPIDGLWIGTYSYKTQPPLYFTFSIYPDGTMSYKSLGVNGYTFYANGTWNLADTTFTYRVVTSNIPGGIQSTQTSVATFSNTAGTLVGINTDSATQSSGTYSMKRDN